MQLIKMLASDEAQKLRSVDRRIPIDLETIVHKAIEKDPAHRYPSAEALAADLRHFIAGEPIESRRISLPGTALALVGSEPMAGCLLGNGRTVDGGADRRFNPGRRFFSASANNSDRISRDKQAEATRANEAERTLRQSLYVAQMNLAADYAAELGGFDQVADLTSGWQPPPRQAGLAWLGMALSGLALPPRQADVRG